MRIKTNTIKIDTLMIKTPTLKPKESRGIAWRGIRYLLANDSDKILRRHFLRHPLRHALGAIRSLFTKNHHRHEGLFLYGLDDIQAFQELIAADDTVVVVGFSYCHKPKECPSGRFTTECLPSCQQCFIGQALHRIPKDYTPIVVTTVQYVGEQMFNIIEKHPGKKVIFIMTACEMMLTMFAPLATIMGAKGIGIKLDGRVCTTTKGFTLAEDGNKPGVTVVTPYNQSLFFEILGLQ